MNFGTQKGQMWTSFLIGLIRLYQLTIAPFLGSTCRFTPSCSHYTQQALKKHGPLRGSWLGLKRICRCGPWHPGGYDPLDE